VRLSRGADLGKGALPDDLLSRPGPLSGPELEHAHIGAGLDHVAGTHRRPDAGTLVRAAVARLSQKPLRFVPARSDAPVRS
jgi:hypothetical protein